MENPEIMSGWRALHNKLYNVPNVQQVTPVTSPDKQSPEDNNSGKKIIVGAILIGIAVFGVCKLIDWWEQHQLTGNNKKQEYYHT